MQTEPPTRPSPLWRNGRLDQEFAELWNRGVLTRVERRWISVAAHTATGVPGTIRPYVYGALRSGDLTVDQLLEGAYHAAYYTGFPRAQQLDDAVWEVADELGFSPTDALTALIVRLDPPDRTGVWDLEVFVAKWRLFRVPELLTGSFLFGLLAVSASFFLA